MFTLGQGSVVGEKAQNGEFKRAERWAEERKRSVELHCPFPSPDARSARLATALSSPLPPPPPPPPATPLQEPGPRLSRVLMCRQCNLTVANLHFAAHLNIGA